jgi:potassium/hydrogen antiporter
MFDAMNIAILIGSALVAAAAFTSLLSFRFGAPLLLIFLLIGLFAGEDGLGLEFDNLAAAYFIGSVALAIILFDAGYATKLATLQVAGLPALVLATAGVLITALIVGLAAQVMLGFSWLQGLLLGVIVAPTDAAAVFFLLRVGGITLRDRVRSTLEIESGSNDPIAIFLTIALVGLFTAPSDLGGMGVDVLGQLLLQLLVGALVGFAGGVIIIQVVNRTSFEPALYPIVVIALALTVFALAGLAHGSGFLAVYVAGLASGNARMRHAAALHRFQEGTTWLSQIAMFLTLGLLATPSEFPRVAVAALALAGFLILVARPAAVWLCLLPFRYTRHEMAFVSWVGLRGAVSILLAILPVMAGVPDGRTMFNVAFVVVLASLLVQGWTISPMARFLGLVVPGRRGPVDRMELELPGSGRHEIVAYSVHPESAVAHGQRIPHWARPSLIIRDGRTLRPHRMGRPEAGDRVYLITTADYVDLLDKLFAGPAPGLDDPDLYGEFALQPDALLGDVAHAYPALVAPGDAELTVAEFLRRELAGDIEPGDRVSLGPVDLIVRRVSEAHAPLELGLAMEHAEEALPRIPLFQSPGEIRELVKWWQERWRERFRRKAAIPGKSDGRPEEDGKPVNTDPRADGEAPDREHRE